MTKHKLLEDLKSHFETIGVIRNLAQECNQKLIDFLLKDSQYSNEYKSRFFLESAGMLIFKQQDFLTFLDLKNLSGSFTSYASKIGLSSKTRGLLKASNEVVLNFAYKDGVLKGGQSKDEEKQDEIFFNEILAKDEIDALFEPKVLQNFEAIGDESLEKLIAEESNILIKGNNLLALHSLKKKYQGKVKLIYIDPPYNTGNDSFNYNDKFNHSTWLTFMKNRLEIAREFLRDDGVIFVQCDDNEQAYLKVLMDEIFREENFVANCPIITNRGGRDYGGIAKTHEYILIYKKTYLAELNQLEDKNKNFEYEDTNGGFDLMELRNRNIRFNKENRPNLYYPFYLNPLYKDKNGLFELSLSPKKDFIEIYPQASQGVDTVWRWGKEKAERFLNLELRGKEKKGGGYMIVQKTRIKTKRQRSVWDEKEFVNERGSEHIKMLFGSGIFAYPKSEFILARVIELATNQNDLVMDFFAGSGTTLAVAHKMGRKWIGIEQMDYIQDITKERLKKVIDGEQGGISKMVEWKGGGSFVYAELTPFNAIYREKIKASQDEKELEAIYKDLEEKAFLDYRVDLQEILADQDFKNMSLEDKKETLRLILDENMDYIPIGDIEDKTYDIDEDTIRLNKMFYGEDQ